MATIEVDTKGIQELAREIEKAKKVLIGRLAERGYQLLRAEVPVDTGNLKQGVAPPDVNYQKLQATLTVSARSGRTGATQGTIIGADGEQKKTVSLRPNNAFNYAEAVAKGRPAISPKRAKMLIIPVASAPSGESYLLADGKVYVFRRSAAATIPNPFDERAATRLELEAERIGEAVLREIFE